MSDATRPRVERGHLRLKADTDATILQPASARIRYVRNVYARWVQYLRDKYGDNYRADLPGNDPHDALGIEALADESDLIELERLLQEPS